MESPVNSQLMRSVFASFSESVCQSSSASLRVFHAAMSTGSSTGWLTVTGSPVMDTDSSTVSPLASAVASMVALGVNEPAVASASVTVW